jgi:cyclopropane fatty-acyl-phospholipid synthase-like methyltransferase
MDSNTYMVDVFGYLLVRHEIKSLLDVGCGYGATMKWFADNGLCHVQGIDGCEDAYAGSLMQSQTLLHDFTTGPAPLTETYDLAWSAEFLEHVEEQYMANYMAAFQRAKLVIVTHGEPGQHGHHHVNCQDDEYWIDKFLSNGFKFNANETALLRRTDRWRSGWGRRSLMSFSKI